MSGNNMGGYSIGFGAAIANSRTIVNLVMDCNNIGQYAEEFGLAIAPSRSLTTLYMHDNNIGENAGAFGGAIASSRTLINLYLFDIVSPQVAEEFGRSIAHAASLEYIEGMQDLLLEAQACHCTIQCAMQSEVLPFLPLPLASIVVEYLGNLLDVFDGAAG